MPAWFDRFKKVWASAGSINDPTDAQAAAGWSYIGQAPPTVEQFNSTQAWGDQKDNWLFSQIDEVIKQASLVSADTPLTILRDAILSFNRRYLTSPLTLYIDVSAGDDIAGDGSNLKPWKTIQFAINYLYNKIDGGGQNIFIQLKTAGTYAPVALRGFFNGTITVIGDVLNKRNYIIRNTAGPAIALDSSALLVAKGVSVEGTGSGGDYVAYPGGVVCVRSSIFLYDQIAFGPCTQSHIYCASGATAYPANGASTQYDIYGGSNIHITVDTAGIITNALITINVLNAVTFSTAFEYASASGIINTWSMNIVNKGNITTPNSWISTSFGLINTKANLTIFPTATGLPATLSTVATTGTNAGGLIT